MPKQYSYASFEKFKKIHANFMKPDRNVEDMRINRTITACKMNTKDKNLWIIGTRDKLNKFILNTIGTSPTHLFYRTVKDSWYFYHDQPFIIYGIFDKRNREETIKEIRQVGEWSPRNVGRVFKEINPDLYHCIVISTFTPEEYCKGMDHENDEIGGLKWRYDTLQLK